MEVDISGTGQWVTYKEFSVAAGQALDHRFPPAFSAYWVRVVSAKDTGATAIFVYD